MTIAQQDAWLLYAAKMWFVGMQLAGHIAIWWNRRPVQKRLKEELWNSKTFSAM